MKGGRGAANPTRPFDGLSASKSYRVFPEYHFIHMKYAAVEIVDPFPCCTPP